MNIISFKLHNKSLNINRNQTSYEQSKTCIDEISPRRQATSAPSFINNTYNIKYHHTVDDFGVMINGNKENGS